MKVEFDEYSWPEKRTHRLEEDEHGLPVFCWRDPNSWLPRAVFVLLKKDADPRTALFVHVNGNYDGRGLHLRWMIGAPLAILALLIFIPVWHSYYFVTYTDVMNAPFNLDTAPAIAQGVGDVIIGYLCWPFGAGGSMMVGYLIGVYLASRVSKSMAWMGAKVEISVRDWMDSTSFGIEDAKEAYGSLRTIEPFANEAVQRLIIRGYFGTGDFPVEVSRSTYNAVSVQGLHQILTREFIQKRQAYLDKLPPARARPMRAPTNAPGGRAWSGDIPDRL